MANTLISQGVSIITRSIHNRFEYSEPNLFAVGAIGVFGFPLYYAVWQYLFPQPYENLALRLIGSVLFLPLMFAKYWRRHAPSLIPYYWYFAIFYALPFFFSFMLFKNEGSDVWLMSTLISIFLLSLSVDWLNLFLMSFLGTALAWVAYAISTEHTIWSTQHSEYIPIYLFALTACSAFNYNAALVTREKLRAMRSFGGFIAHELRTPLLGIRAGAAGLQRHLPKLIEGYRLAQNNGLPVAGMRATHLQTIATILDKIDRETVYSNTIINMLLMNAKDNGAIHEEFAVHSMADCVEAALDRYPFKHPSDREKIHWERGADFSFFGSDILMAHVLFNLLKNALYSIEKANKGEISIWIEPQGKEHRLRFRDTGTGIPPVVLPHIFEPFYSNAKGGKGTGLGLSFCKMAVENFGGRISVSSVLGEFTEFVITFKKGEGIDGKV